MTTRNPTPVPAPPPPLIPRDLVRSPAPVFTGAVRSPIGRLDRAPAAVPPGPGTGQTTGGTTTITVPVIDRPDNITPSENVADTRTNVIVAQPVYISVMDEGTTVTRSTTVLNFIGSGVSVTGTSSQANITIASGGSPGGSNTQVQFNNSGSFGGSANLTFNTFTQTLGIGGNVSANNFIGSFFIGNGSQLTGLPASYGNSNVATLLAGFGSNTISTTGNITGGNIIGGANVNATTHTGTTVSVTGNITGGNINGGANVNAVTHTGTTVSVTGNITGSFFVGNGSALTGITSNYGNANVAANLAAFGSNPISTTGNVTAGNFIGGGAGTPTITSTTNLDLSAASAVRVIGGGTFRLPTLTTAQIANLVAANGDMVYNSTTSTIQAYANSAWGNITLS
jgi:hypothetical protein